MGRHLFQRQRQMFRRIGGEPTLILKERSQRGIAPHRQHAKKSSVASTGPRAMAPECSCVNAHCASACAASKFILMTTTM